MAGSSYSLEPAANKMVRDLMRLQVEPLKILQLITIRLREPQKLTENSSGVFGMRIQCSVP